MKKIIITLVLLSCITTFGQTKKTTKTQPKKQATEQPKKQTAEAPVAIEAPKVDSLTQVDKTIYGPEQIETYPVFPECETETPENNFKCFKEQISAHIIKNYNYPKDAQNAGIQGTANVIFDINREGYVEIINSFGDEIIFQEEAKRIISLLPKMKPATQKGKNVTVRFTIPIKFELTE